MQPEEPVHKVTPQVQDIMKMLGKMPVSLTQLLTAYEKYINEINPEHDVQLLENLQEVNRIAIEKKYMSMMVGVYRQIQPHLKFYEERGSLNYLGDKILGQLDDRIYPKGFVLHHFKETPMGEMQEKQKIEMIDKLFSQLLDINYQLLSIFQKYYETQNDERIPEVIFQSLLCFIEENQDSYLIQEDQRSLIYEEKRRSQIKQQQQNEGEITFEKIGGEMVKIIENINKESSQNKGLVSSTVSALKKYSIKEGLGYVSSKIKNINPFNMTKSQMTEEEQEQVQDDLIRHLKPHLSEREELSQSVIEFLKKHQSIKPQNILKMMSKNEKQNFQSIIGNLLDKHEPSNELFAPIVQEIMSLFGLAESMSGIEVKVEYPQIRYIILLYKALSPNYNPERRKFLFNFCRQPEIKENFNNSIGVVKFIESQNVVSSVIVNLLRTLPVKVKDAKKKYELSKKKNDQVSKAIEHQLHRIHIFELDKKFKEYPLIEFEKLTNCPPKKVITIVFSGFMSEDSCKVQQWDKLLQTIYDSEVYSLRWESKTYGDMFDFAVEAGKDIVQANLKVGILGKVGGPYIRAIAVMHEIYKKYQNNPFNPAFESAIITGKFVAELLISSFKGHFINLVGFSLGTELIKNILYGLAQKNELSMINKVYLMGGATDKKEFEEIISNSKSPMNVVNLYSDKDAILKYLLKLCKPSIVPLGLNPLSEIEGHEITNIDCSDFINGHLAYRQRLDVLGKVLNMKDD